MHDFEKYRTSTIALVAANTIPLLGVMFWGWSTFAVVAVYWAENIVIGAINVLKMITCNPDADEVMESLQSKAIDSQQLKTLADQMSETPLAHHGIKLFLVPFFTFHYGFFCFIHGVFVFVLFGGDKLLAGPGPSFSGAFDRFSQEHLWWAVIALAISHLVSFFTNYIGRGEYRRTIVPILMISPYQRIVVLHLAILFGGFAVMALGSPVIALLILIVGKTILDVRLHLKERRRNESDSSDPPTASQPNSPGIW
jgi:hypothetical protein